MEEYTHTHTHTHTHTYNRIMCHTTKANITCKSTILQLKINQKIFLAFKPYNNS